MRSLDGGLKLLTVYIRVMVMVFSSESKNTRATTKVIIDTAVWVAVCLNVLVLSKL